jgi:hypothetical protein
MLSKRFPSLPQLLEVVREGPRPNGAFSWLVYLPLGTTTYNGSVSTAAGVAHPTFYTEADHELDPKPR